MCFRRFATPVLAFLLVIGSSWSAVCELSCAFERFGSSPDSAGATAGAVLQDRWSGYGAFPVPAEGIRAQFTSTACDDAPCVDLVASTRFFTHRNVMRTLQQLTAAHDPCALAVTHHELFVPHTEGRFATCPLFTLRV